MLSLKEVLTRLVLTSRRLPNYYSPDGGNNNRPRSADISLDNSGGIVNMLATGSMTVSKPKNNGHILHFHWDNSNVNCCQLNVPIDYSGVFQFRRQIAANTWGGWIDLCSIPEAIANAGVDLNDFNTTCSRYASSNSIAAKCHHCPTTQAFRFWMYPVALPGYAIAGDQYQYYVQVIVDISANVYIRNLSTNVNSEWQYGTWKKITTADLAT